MSGNDRLFMRIQNRIRDSIELAKKRVSRNYKTAIPSYFPKCNTMSLMLPLCLTDEEKPTLRWSSSRPSPETTRVRPF